MTEKDWASLWITIAVFGIPFLLGLALYALDYLLGWPATRFSRWIHRRWTRRRRLNW